MPRSSKEMPQYLMTSLKSSGSTHAHHDCLIYRGHSCGDKRGSAHVSGQTSGHLRLQARLHVSTALARDRRRWANLDQSSELGSLALCQGHLCLPSARSLL